MTDPTPAGHTSVVRLADAWYVACESARLRRKPVAVSLLGTPLALFRNERGEAGALLDRCPHRNVPLSLGAVRGCNLQCSYHGWQFDRHGACRAVPGLCREHISPARRVAAYPACEQDGFVWVYANPDVRPQAGPYRFPLIGEPGYTTVRQEVAAEASVHAVAENALDVPHTAYLHGGLFRPAGGTGNEIQVVVRRWTDRVEAEYIGEPRPSSLAGKLLAPGGGAVAHFDRFILPSITQVEYRLGGRSHLCVTAVLTPVADFRTRIFTVTSFRLPLPGWLVKPVLRPVALRIFGQDAEILRAQTETIRRFGGEQFKSTEIDVLGPHIYYLLRQAQRGAPGPDGAPVTRTLRMRI